MASTNTFLGLIAYKFSVRKHLLDIFGRVKGTTETQCFVRACQHARQAAFSVLSFKEAAEGLLVYSCCQVSDNRN